jgi:transcriptional regulator with XRE-family HTH domain
MKTLGVRLKKAREDAHLSQTQLARLVNLSQQTISKIESGRARGIMHLLSLAKVLRVNADWLASGTGSMRPTTGDKILDQVIADDVASYFVATDLFDNLLTLSEVQLDLVSRLVDQLAPTHRAN